MTVIRPCTSPTTPATRRRTTAAAACLLAAAAAHADITFDPPITLATANRPSSAALGDLNGDLLPDLAVTADDPDRILLFFNDAAGVLTPAGSILTGAGTGPDDIAAGDVDRDGDLDLLVVLDNISTLRVYLNSGAGVFTAGPSAPTGANARGLSVGDLDNDADADFAVANRDANTVSIFINNGTLFVPQVIPVGLEPRDTAIGDLDGDGRADVVVTNHDSRSLTVLLQTAPGAFAPSTLFVSPTVRPEGVDIADVNGDGLLDIATATSDDALSFATIFINAGGGAFGAPINIPSGGVEPGPILARDLDADGDTDLVTGNEDSGNISILDNLGAMTFAPPQLIPTGANPGSLAAGDLFGLDGPELIVVNRDANTTTILTNASAVPCTADWNGTGAVDSNDISAFLTDWLAGAQGGTLLADFNGDSAVNSNDISAFLTAWLSAVQTGC